MSLNSRHHDYITSRLDTLTAQDHQSTRDCLEADILRHVLAEMATGQIMSNRPIHLAPIPVEPSPTPRSAPSPKPKTPRLRHNADSDGLFRVFLITDRQSGLLHLTSSKFTEDHVLEKLDLSGDQIDITVLTMSAEEPARALGGTLHGVFAPQRIKREDVSGYWYPPAVLPTMLGIIQYGDGLLAIDTVSRRLPDHGARCLDPQAHRAMDWRERVALIAREYLLLNGRGDDASIAIPEFHPIAA